MVIDKTFLHNSILSASPFRPEEWVIWIYVFGMPHVIGGMQTFADTEYIKRYGWKLMRIMIACLLLPILVWVVFGWQSLFVVFTLFIVYHTVAQQFGLTIVALKKAPGFLFYVWKWTAVGVGVLLYLMIYSEPHPIAVVDNGLRGPFITVIEMLLVINILSAAALVWKNRTNKIGVLYLIANASLILVDCFLFYMHYYFLMVIVGRIIHEFTAWPIYVVHDHNRNSVDTKNWIFSMFDRLIPPAIMSLIFAFSFGFALTFIASKMPYFSLLVISLSFYHYYSEHFLWRRDGLLRKHVAFVV